MHMWDKNDLRKRIHMYRTYSARIDARVCLVKKLKNLVLPSSRYTPARRAMCLSRGRVSRIRAAELNSAVTAAFSGTKRSLNNVDKISARTRAIDPEL